MNRKLTYTARLLLVGLILSPGAASIKAATSLSQFGITWTFDKDYPTGQFANGDYWVVGPVKIVSISPKSTTSSGRTINGSMVNPAVGKAQGYDSATYATYGASYSGNVAAGISSSNPLTLNAGSSLISSISNPTAGARPQLTSAAVLTVLSSAAPAGSFRPPYTGTDKTLRWNKSQLKYSLLRSLSKVANTPALATVEAKFERPWLEHNPSWTGRYIHPSENMPDYGRDMANALAEGLLSLQLDYSAPEKEKLLIRLVQYGLDVYAVAKAGGVWEDLGGHNQGRKMPMVLAGMMLGDADILALADGSKKIFQEDRQTWYVTAADVGRDLYTADGRPREEYIAADVGIPEWGEMHTRQPNRDGRNWDAYYRDIVGSSYLGHMLTARLMKAEGVWKWPAAFDYADRYWSKEKGSATSAAGNSIRPFVHAMWTAHRNATSGSYTSGAPASEPAPPTSTAAPVISTQPVSQTIAPGGSVTFKVTAAGDGLSYQWLKNGVAIAGATSSTLTVSSLTTANAGDYSVRVTNAAGSTTSSFSRLVVASPATGRLVNASVRSMARGSGSPLTMGFVVAGSGRDILVRSVGPSLASLGVTGSLPDPRITVYEPANGTSRAVASNNNWTDAGADAIRTAASKVGAFSLASGSLDSALIAHVAGARTVQTVDTQGRSGVALAEIYDLGTDSENRIVNLSARNFVGTGEQVLIAGFIVSGNVPKRVLIRGIGPGLKSFGVNDALADPKIDVHTTTDSSGGKVDTVFASNDNWAQAGTSTLQAAFKATGAFALSDTASKDAAIVAELPAGAYTVVLSGVGGGTGEGLIEIYEMP
ncbi:MAG TPA: immunoglobulin domain-containing protein [Opitutaceae bacterium]